MKKLMILLIAVFILNSYSGAEDITNLQCKCESKINKDYYYKEGKWLNETKKNLILRDKVFSKLDTENPIIKSITLKNKYSEEQSTEFEGTVIHRTDSIIMIKWKNDFGNKIWIATINLKSKTAVVAESYDGFTSFGINIETTFSRLKLKIPT